jgi:hypothetical protein
VRCLAVARGIPRRPPLARYRSLLSFLSRRAPARRAFCPPAGLRARRRDVTQFFN